MLYVLLLYLVFLFSFRFHLADRHVWGKGHCRRERGFVRPAIPTSLALLPHVPVLLCRGKCPQLSSDSNRQQNKRNIATNHQRELVKC